MVVNGRPLAVIELKSRADENATVWSAFQQLQTYRTKIRSRFYDLRSQSVISSWGGRRYPPHALTERRVSMLSIVLRSKQTILVNIEIMSTFVSLRRMLGSHDDLARKFADLERKYDAMFKVVFDAIQQLMSPLERGSSRPVGFVPMRDD